MKKILVILCLTAFVVFPGYTYASAKCLIAGRGCCSSHGGVCGCAGGRSKCCDGTLSPSCQCFRDDVKGGLEL